ncbi:MAG: amidohydrolase family protein [Spirochaetales bacterium]|nr:amidohydrolase family protein [Spirochaetales bacterium]
MQDLREYIMNQPLFDTHEHLFGYKQMDDMKDSMLYKEVMECYASNAVTTSYGSPLHEAVRDELSPEDSLMDYFGYMRTEGKDDFIFDAWPYVRTTGYGEGIEMGIRESFGMEWSKENKDRITAAMRQEISTSGAKGLYKRLLDKSNIIGIINCAYWVSLMNEPFANSGDFPEILKHTLDHGQLYSLGHKSTVEQYERDLQISITKLEDLDRALNEHTEKGFKEGWLAAHKIGAAYARPLNVGAYEPEKASRIFDKIMAGEAVDDLKPLSDYFIHRTVQRSSDLNMPIQIHTGLLAGSYTKVTQGNPEALIPLLRKYRNARFDLFHSSWPHTETLSAIALSFPNVWIDMCWAWTINPEQMERNLSEWLSCVPYNKIFGFGGDTSTPVNTAGYAVQARRGIANVLEEKVRKGRMSASTAEDVADALLWRNAKDFFNY